MWFTDLFLDYFPGYNKFRTVSMTLVIAELTIPLLAFMGLREIFLQKVDVQKLRKYFFITSGIVGLTLLTFIAMPGIMGVEGTGEYTLAEQMASGVPDDPQYAQVKQELKLEVVNALQTDRLTVIRNDAFRSLVFVMLGAVVLWFVMRKKIKPTYAFLLFGAIILVDAWGVNRRYLNNDNFVSPKKFEVPYTPTRADNIINQDKDLSYRVCNLAVSVFNDASTSYFHKSIGGYHGAKMRRYQTLMDSVMGSEMQMASYLANVALQNGFKEDEVSAVFNSNSSNPVLNMLNARYIIYNSQAKPIRNQSALGNAWFVNAYEVVPDSESELLALRSINTATSAVVSEDVAQNFKGFKPIADSTASIRLTSYSPNYLKYESETASPQLAVFSEIYYPKGWQAYIDGKEAEHFHVNYVLRSMIVPEGKHVIEFRFQPASYKLGNTISYISSLLLLLLITWFGYKYYRDKKILTKK
jgi:hypothetical protein